MPGFSGVFSPSHPHINPSALLESMASANDLGGLGLRHDRYVERLFGLLMSRGPCHLGYRSWQSHRPGGRSRLFLWGEIHNQRELRRAMGLAEPEAPDPCRLLLDLYERHGPSFTSRVNGEFAIVVHEPERPRLRIFSDHLATRPIFWSDRDGWLRFGSEMKSVLALDDREAEIDPVGLLQLFAHGHNLGSRTYLSHVETLPAGTMLEHDGRSATLRPCVRPGYRLRRNRLAPGELVEEWAGRLVEATRARIDGRSRTVVSLSGGLDSRAVSAALPRETRPVTARTFGDPESPEVACARAVAGRLGFDFLHEAPLDVPLSGFLVDAVRRTECTLSFAHCQSIAVHDTLKHLGDVLAGGQLGDIGSGAHIFPYTLVPRSRERFIDITARRYMTHGRPSLRSVFSEEFLARTLPDLEDAFRSSFETLPKTSNARLYETWDLKERQTHLTMQSRSTDTHLFRHAHPCADRDYLAFTMSIPTRLRFGQTLYQMVIHELGPELRDIPNANTGLLLKGTFAGNLWNKARELGTKATDRVVRRLPLRRTPLRLRMHSDLNDRVRRDEDLRVRLYGFLESPGCDDAVFDRTAIIRMLGSHYAGTAAAADLICTLATYATARELFVEAPRAPVADHRRAPRGAQLSEPA